MWASPFSQPQKIETFSWLQALLLPETVRRETQAARRVRWHNPRRNNQAQHNGATGGYHPASADYLDNVIQPTSLRNHVPLAELRAITYQRIATSLKSHNGRCFLDGATSTEELNAHIAPHSPGTTGSSSARQPIMQLLGLRTHTCPPRSRCRAWHATLLPPQPWRAVRP